MGLRSHCQVTGDPPAGLEREASEKRRICLEVKVWLGLSGWGGLA